MNLSLLFIDHPKIQLILKLCITLKVRDLSEGVCQIQAQSEILNNV